MRTCRTCALHDLKNLRAYGSSRDYLAKGCLSSAVCYVPFPCRPTVEPPSLKDETPRLSSSLAPAVRGNVDAVDGSLVDQLRQLRAVSRSFTSTATLVHSSLTCTSRLCFSRPTVVFSLYIGLPAVSLYCLDRVLRSGFLNVTIISAYMRDVLHWFPMRQCIEFRVAVLVWYYT